MWTFQTFIISKHLMLLFISIEWLLTGKSTTFQNISCYSLSFDGGHRRLLQIISKHLMLLFIALLCFPSRIVRNFKTSHVTLYPELIAPVFTFPLFQNISCYSLSRNRRKLLRVCLHFKTSHVTLYQEWAVKHRKEFPNFKTSHVTLYQWTDQPL